MSRTLRWLVAAALGVSLAACSTPSRWQTGFAAAPGAPEVAPVEKVSIRWAKYEPLNDGKILDGFTLLGTTRFRDEPLDEREFTRGSALERYAKSIGADTVLVGMNPAGKETRVKYVRVGSPSGTIDPGDPTGGGRTVESVPYEEQVDVCDYIVVYLHAPAPAGR